MPERSTFNEVGRFMTVASTDGRFASIRRDRLRLSYASLASRFQHNSGWTKQIFRRADWDLRLHYTLE